MEFNDFIQLYPAPTRFARGQKKVKMTIYVSEQEEEVIRYLMRNMPALYDDNDYQVVRHALAHFLIQMQDYVKHELPWLQRIKEGTAKAAKERTQEAILERLDSLFDNIAYLMSFGYEDAALEEYEKFRAEVQEMPEYWQAVFLNNLSIHPQLEWFEKRLSSDGHVKYGIILDTYKLG